MKRIIYKILMLPIFVLIWGGCETDDYTKYNPAPETDRSVITFGVNIPYEQVVNARGEAIQPGMIENMYVLVFDADHNFLTRAKAVETSNPGRYKVTLSRTDISLPQAKKKRIVHFICNYNWAGFADIDHIGKHENEVITGLTSSNGQLIYWQRKVVVNGITENAFPDNIELLRNKAKISLVNCWPTDPTDISYLRGAQFALGDYLNSGTVAPFNTESLAFEEGAVCEPPEGTIQTATLGDFVNATENGITGEEILCYERKNSTSKTPMYIILKGKYGTSSNESYYKIDIANEIEEVLYDITRNNHYAIRVTEVTASGYPTLQEAINNPASNNLLYSVILQDYTAISNGKSALKVEVSHKTLVQPDSEFKIHFSYIPDLTTAAEDNTLVTVQLLQNNMSKIVEVASQDVITTDKIAHYKAKTVGTVPQYNINTADLVFTAIYNGEKLRRTVTLNYRRPSVFEDVYTVPSTLPLHEDIDVEIRFTIPSSISDKQFPIEVFITSLVLTPDPDYPSELSLDYQKPGIFRYKYIARRTGEHIVHFKTTTVVTGSDKYVLESELFTTKERYH